jgi:citronellyl-CoA dehydrogenase
VVVHDAVQFQEERLWACASNLKAFEMVINDTIAYTSVRKTFGKPISANQAVQFRLAELLTEVCLLGCYLCISDIAVQVELLRSLVYRALGLYLDGKDVTYLTSMAKLK